MSRWIWVLGLVAAGAGAGCHSDIVTTKYLRELESPCVYIAPLESDEPQVGRVISDVLEKEFVRKRVDLCDPMTATVLITGATFMTVRGRASGSAQACESVSVIAKDREGRILLSASYDNRNRASVSEFAREFGAALADKFR